MELIDLLRKQGGQYLRDIMPGGLLSPEIPPEMPTQTLKGLLGITPVVGDAISGYDAIQSAREGNYGEAALNSLGLLPFVPAMGGVVKPVVDNSLLDVFTRKKMARQDSTIDSLGIDVESLRKVVNNSDIASFANKNFGTRNPTLQSLKSSDFFKNNGLDVSPHPMSVGGQYVPKYAVTKDGNLLGYADVEGGISENVLQLIFNSMKQ